MQSSAWVLLARCAAANQAAAQSSNLGELQAVNLQQEHSGHEYDVQHVVWQAAARKCAVKSAAVCALLAGETRLSPTFLELRRPRARRECPLGHPQPTALTAATGVSRQGHTRAISAPMGASCSLTRKQANDPLGKFAFHSLGEHRPGRHSEQLRYALVISAAAAAQCAASWMQRSTHTLLHSLHAALFVTFDAPGLIGWMAWR